MSSSEFTYALAFDRLSPLDGWREDYRAGWLASALRGGMPTHDAAVYLMPRFGPEAAEVAAERKAAEQAALLAQTKADFADYDKKVARLAARKAKQKAASEAAVAAAAAKKRRKGGG